MPKPLLQAMVLADKVYQDRTTGKFIIAGTFSTIGYGARRTAPTEETEEPEDEGKLVATGPYGLAGSPSLYLALADIYGQVPLHLKFTSLADSSVPFEAKIVITAASPIVVAEYIIPLPPLPVDRPGTYSLDLFYENEMLGSWRVTVVCFDSPQEQAGEEKK